MSDEKVREWKLYEDDEGDLQCGRWSGCDDKITHVIEKSAYNQLMKDASALRDAIESAMEAKKKGLEYTPDKLLEDAISDFDKKYSQLNEKE